MSVSEGSGFTPEQIDALARVVARLELPESVKRMMAGHDEPDAGCILDGIGRMVILSIDPDALPLLLGFALARSTPEDVKRFVDEAVDQSAEALISDLTAGLIFPDSEVNR